LQARGAIGASPSILVLSRREAERFAPDWPYAVISITDPDQDPANLPQSQYCRGVLRLEFHDVSDLQLTDDLTSEPYTEEHAEAVAEFVRGHTGCRLLVIHCEAGLSRSAGVGAAVGLWLHGSEREFYQRWLPNAHVRELTLEALRAASS
jgi:predicted protein tyrosine phosphatase